MPDGRRAILAEDPLGDAPREPEPPAFCVRQDIRRILAVLEMGKLIVRGRLCVVSQGVSTTVAGPSACNLIS